MRQVFDGWGVASKRKGSIVRCLSYDILSAPVATDEYISCVVGDIIYHSNQLLNTQQEVYFLCNYVPKVRSISRNS